jgi:hypothetical protein
MMMMMMTTLKNQIHTFSCLDTEFQLLQWTVVLFFAAMSRLSLESFNAHFNRNQGALTDTKDVSIWTSPLSKTELNSVALVRKRTIPTEPPPLVDYLKPRTRNKCIRPAALFPGENPGCPLQKKNMLGGPQSRSRRREEEKILDPTGTQTSTPPSSRLQPVAIPTALSRSFRFPTKILYAFLFAPMRATCPHDLILFYLITRIIFVQQNKLWSSSSWSSLQSSC